MILSDYQGIQLIEEDATPDSYGLWVYVVKGPGIHKRTFKGEFGRSNAERYWHDLVIKRIYS